MSETRPKLITPPGIAKWAWLNKPKAPYQGDADKGSKYMIDVVFDANDPKWREWAVFVQNEAEKLRMQHKNAANLAKAKLPAKADVDEADKPTGLYYVTFKTSEKFKPDVYDRYGERLAENILVGNGSKVRVAYNINYYDGFGGGINLYLSAVQVIDLVEYKGRSAGAYGFEVETAPASAAGGPPPQGEDDLPF
jgi:hypothetical protein